jgi:hypothetical protein
VLLPVKMVVPVPSWSTRPVPLIAPASASVFERFSTSAALLVMSPTTAPVVPPLPSCRVPAAMVVPPA